MDIKELYALARILGYSGTFNSFERQFNEYIENAEKYPDGSPQKQAKTFDSPL